MRENRTYGLKGDAKTDSHSEHRTADYQWPVTSIHRATRRVRSPACSNHGTGGHCWTRSEGRVVRRDQLEHLIRAAGAILDESEVIVIGSQAILASFDQSQLP